MTYIEYMDKISGYIMVVIFVIGCLGIPIVISIANIYGLLKPKYRRKRFFWLMTVEAGVSLSAFYMYSPVIFDRVVTNEAWNVQLRNPEVHEIMNAQCSWIYYAIVLIGVVGFIILAVSRLSKTPPLVTVLEIAAMYLAAITLLIWCIQISVGPKSIPLMILPFNLVIMMCSLIREKIMEWNEERERVCTGRLDQNDYAWHDWLLENAQYLPLYALIAAIPLLGIILGISILFGQRPDALIAAWTETADWRLSQMIPPPNLPYDGHYLCTVAAGGHRKVVKPLRMGERHRHRVVVNRQLEIANAFELVLEEKTPGLHKAVRGFYDRFGLPIANRIRTKGACDVVYVLMKPLEWIFLIVIYLTQSHPEDLIAIQYMPGYRKFWQEFKKEKGI